MSIHFESHHGKRHRYPDHQRPPNHSPSDAHGGVEGHSRTYTLEQNLRVDFASVQEMRTINDQMRAAGITKDHVVTLGAGRVQVVQCFSPTKKPWALDLCTMLRREEVRAVSRWECGPPRATIPASIACEDVPF